MADRIGSGEFTYEVEPAWAQVPDGWIIKDTPDVLVDDAHDRVYLFTRWKHPVMVFDRAGTFITSWGSDLFTMPHGLSMGPDGHLYLVDAFGHCIRKCTTAGELLQVWGTPDRGSGHYSGKPFNGPTKVAFDPGSGDMYVADGYGNARVHKYSAAGDYLFSWGEPGQGPSQFNLVHSVQTDRAGNVYVASREGHRVQVFDRGGAYLSEWRTGVHRPNGFFITAAGRDRELVYVGEAGAGFGENRGIRGFGDCLAIFELDGTCVARIYHDSPVMKGPHGIGVRRRRQRLPDPGAVGQRPLDRPHGPADDDPPAPGLVRYRTGSGTWVSTTSSCPSSRSAAPIRLVAVRWRGSSMRRTTFPSTPRRRARALRESPLSRSASINAAFAAVSAGTATSCSSVCLALGTGIGSPFAGG